MGPSILRRMTVICTHRIEGPSTVTLDSCWIANNRAVQGSVIVSSDRSARVSFSNSTIFAGSDDVAAIFQGTMEQTDTVWSCSGGRTGIKISSTTLLYTLECGTCVSGTYSVVVASSANKAFCRPCPFAGNCTGGTVLATINMWGELKGDEVEFHVCPVGFCCDSALGCEYDHCEGGR